MVLNQTLFITNDPNPQNFQFSSLLWMNVPFISAYGNALEIKINENEEHLSTLAEYKLISHFSSHVSSILKQK